MLVCLLKGSDKNDLYNNKEGTCSLNKPDDCKMQVSFGFY
jgi:hypothetical protein